MKTLVVTNVSLVPFFGLEKNSNALADPKDKLTPWGYTATLNDKVRDRLNVDVVKLKNSLVGTDLNTIAPDDAASAAQVAIKPLMPANYSTYRVVTLYFPQPDNSHEIVLIIIDDSTSHAALMRDVLFQSAGHPDECYDMHVGLRIDTKVVNI